MDILDLLNFYNCVSVVDWVFLGVVLFFRILILGRTGRN